MLQNTPSRILLLTLLAALSTGCVSGEQADNNAVFTVENAGEVIPITVWNRSQYTVDSLKISADGVFLEASELLTEPLDPEDALLVDTFASGDYVTFARERVEGGDSIAVTTSRPIGVSETGYTLILFDEDFRLLDPDSPDNPYSVIEADTTGTQ